MPEKVILLVEDSPDDEFLVRRALRGSEFGPDVVVARDGLAALAYLRERLRDDSALPDVILLDLNLPRLSGFDVLREIRADEGMRFLPIVILTSSREDRDVAFSYQLGANSYVRKPIMSEDFADTIRQVGAYWLTLNEVPLARTSP